ncbi:methylated-DNA--[protein]-cysteine S-methyltransferase [Bergeyella zoohelcum]|uniref:methylated-DNA--[protein]-cysteine S-methyltransferase n=1 Tax=Bergeyella zoohelcum TaxID=1015 RepID=A0A7Z9CGW3_9FLAO|nr:methylated-DNA--[protein]-cysteine S-methyltransferase [Bergeyella zoohelcum]VDH05941.1 methylated-DNA--protein-cysteine methyltransferase [Bergeyella zoohelcum]
MKEKLITENAPTLFHDISEADYSKGNDICHDALVHIQRMTTDEYQNKDGKLTIAYHYADSLFGKVLVASTHKGVCYLGFEDGENKAFKDLLARFPKAKFTEQSTIFQQQALAVFQNIGKEVQKVKLHLWGTDFQFKVWKSLLKIPFGKRSSYGEIAHEVGSSKAYRAVGTAVGKNPVSFLIPCHRVLPSSGAIGGYMWGSTRKAMMIAWEAARS